ncbi:hypothetical protein LZC95_34020 [Pendulispora brunnea]|uniref:Secreted protein n=1 Tax=Pendulispora brunnea TaxID=2905690 RepID=A0ABZ2K2P9_9BACT
MDVRARVLGIVVLAATGFTVGMPAWAEPAHPAAESRSLQPMNYWYMEGHYATESECRAKGESLLWPANPGGADGYECRANGGGWDLWLMFLT